MVTSEIIEDIRGGNLKAFELLFNDYYQKVKSFAYGMLKDSDEAENVAQNVFMKLWLGRSRLVGGKSLDSYIFTIVRNEIYDMFRSSRVSLEFAQLIKSKSSSDDGYEIDSYFNIKEIRKIVNQTIEQMPEQRKLIFTMSRKQCLSNDEIAARLSISKRTVEKHISLALASIRSRLGDFLCWIFIFFMT